jgi:hypothetical protein
VGIRCADHATPLYPQRLALTSSTSGGCSVGIVRLRTTATEFSSSLCEVTFIRLSIRHNDQATGYMAEETDFHFRRVQESYSSPHSLDLLLGQPSLLRSGCWSSFIGEQSGWGVKPTDFHPMATLRMRGARTQFAHTSSWRGA